MSDSNMRYVVVNSKTNQTGIHLTWGEASAYVTGVGLTIRRLRSIRLDTPRLERRSVETRKQEECFIPAKASSSHKHEVLTNRPDVVQERAAEGYYPPRELIGVDPSTKTEDEVFGIDVASGEAELRDALCPPGLSDALAKGLVNATIDVVSMPGGFFGGGESETILSETGVLGEAMAELVNQK